MASMMPKPLEAQAAGAAMKTHRTLEALAASTGRSALKARTALAERTALAALADPLWMTK